MSEIQIHRADWVLPVVEPSIRDGAVAIGDGHLLDVGSITEVESAHPDALIVEHGQAILLPGLVNAHTHLSLSHLSGLDAGAGLMDWLGRLARTAADMTVDEVRASVEEGVKESWELGTVLVGEITTRSEGLSKILEHDHMMARVYFEFVGVREPRARALFEAAKTNVTAMLEDPFVTGVLPGLSPHAPYTVWPELWRDMVKFSEDHGIRWSTHFAEAPGEREFILEGKGPLKDFLDSMGVWDGTFPIPEVSGVELLASSGVLEERCLLVHALHVSPDELIRISESGASICICPRSNRYLGLPSPRPADLLAAGVNVCLGTDSRASNSDLSMWAEMRAVREIEPTPFRTGHPGDGNPARGAGPGNEPPRG